MSNFGSTHLVTPFTSGKSQALTGQRLAVVKYKTTEKQKAKFPNVCVSVPHISHESIIDSMESLLVHVQAWLEEKQTDVIRSLYEGSQGTLSQVNDSEISIGQIVGYLSAENVGSRLTKEAIGVWFKENVSDNLARVLARKLWNVECEHLTVEQSKVLNMHVEKNMQLITALAGGATTYADNIVESLKRVIALSDCENDSMGEKLTKRLDSMLIPKDSAGEFLL